MGVNANVIGGNNRTKWMETKKSEWVETKNQNEWKLSVEYADC